jgi:hypothetical protein
VGVIRLFKNTLIIFNILFNLMSNYANFNDSFELSNDIKNNTKEIPNIKNKFITSDDHLSLSYGYYNREDTKSNVIDNESSLITPAINKKEKVQMKLIDDLNPKNFNIQYTNNLKTEFCEKNTGFYYTNKNTGAGRGFGNLLISNDIRNSNTSRHDTKKFKEVKEGQQFFDYQFEYLDRNFQDPSHIVMQIPRGGESTRKQNQLTVNTMRNDTSDYNERIKTVKFNY